MVVNDVPTPEAVMGIRLKFDDAILNPEPQAYSSIDEIKIDDLDFTVSQERYPDDEQEDLLNDTNLLVNDIHIKREATSSDTDFDLCAIADELGLDISLLAQILSEYIEEIDTKMPIIKAAINQKILLLPKMKFQSLKVWHTIYASYSCIINLNLLKKSYMMKIWKRLTMRFYISPKRFKHSKTLSNDTIFATFSYFNKLSFCRLF